ncbi:SIMPL domain-containing protein [Aeromicrobium sp. CTD01-1L150]|uniref:SIMPL domain-containing protein n=1 Tax=Aeromicrobium sp. CTD01-1L150 TaxID=3341830 RepID=UPI0035BF7544
MSLQITVRGTAEGHHPAERATVEMAAAVEGPDKEAVLQEAVGLQEPLAQQLRSLADRGAVTTWSSDQLQVFSRRPWDGGVQSRTPVHTARLRVRAEFVDFERLNGFIEHWAGHAGMEVKGVAWEVTAKNRRLYEAEVRKAAVDDAVVKAQAYADALRRGRVVAVELSDPGMLDGAAGVDPPVPMARLAGAAADGGDGSLALEPEEIVIRVEVDARFRAD